MVWFSAVDEQNAQTISNNDLAQSIVSAATTAVSGVSVPAITTQDLRHDNKGSLSGNESLKLIS